MESLASCTVSVPWLSSVPDRWAKPETSMLGFQAEKGDPSRPWSLYMQSFQNRSISNTFDKEETCVSSYSFEEPIQVVNSTDFQSSHLMHRRSMGSDVLEDNIFENKFLIEATQALQYMHEESVEVPVDIYSGLIKKCIYENNILMARKLLTLIASQGLEADEHLGCELMDMFIHFGCLAEANRVFAKLSEPTPLMWDRIIRANAVHGQNVERVQLFNLLHKLDLELDEHVFVSILKACSSLDSTNYGFRIHALIIENGLEYNKYIGCTLIDLYTKHLSPEYASVTFHRLPKENDVTWNALMSGYSRAGYSEKALQLFYAMQQGGVKPDRVSFICALKACSKIAACEDGREIHNNIIVLGLECGYLVSNTLVNMYASSGNLMDATWVFKNLHVESIEAWNALMTGYIQNDLAKEALELFQKMQYQMIRPDHVTFICVLKACSALAAVDYGKTLHIQIIESSYMDHVNINNTLVDMYAKCGCFQEALYVFHRIPNPDVVTWSALISGYVENGYEEEALNLFNEMREQGIQPNSITFLSVIKACSSLQSMDQCQMLHSTIVGDGLESDIFVRRSVLNMYINCLNIEDALITFQRMPSRDIVTWTFLVEGCIQLGYGKYAIRLFKDMNDEGLEPDPVFFSCTLRACSSRNAIEEGRQLHAYIVQRGIKIDPYMGSALTDLYAKAEYLEEARTVFNCLCSQNIVVWNSLMAGYTSHGNGTETLKLYQEMQKQGLQPDEVTCLCALKACSSLLAFEQGRKIHQYIVMKQFELDDFIGSTLVDMYAKCGSLGDACVVFQCLPKRTVVTWNALIAGCARHNDYYSAVQLFLNMEQLGLQMNDVTFACILSACVRGGTLQEGLVYFKSIKNIHSLTPTLEHYNLLIDLLGREGHLCEAEDLLETIPFQSTSVGWTSLLSSCELHLDINIGRRSFERLLVLDKHNAGVYMLLSQIYEKAGLKREANEVDNLRMQASCWKKPANACIEVNSCIHYFTVGDRCHPQSPQIYSKISSLHAQMRKEEYHNHHVDSELVSLFHNEVDTCGHCEKLAIAFGLLSTPQGATIRVSKNIRMCVNCHKASKIISKIEMREIIVSDTYCIHHFHDGKCSCNM